MNAILALRPVNETVVDAKVHAVIAPHGAFVGVQRDAEKAGVILPREGGEIPFMAWKISVDK